MSGRTSRDENRNRRTLPVMSREGGGNVTGTNNSSDTNGGGDEWLEQLSSSQSTIMEAGTRLSLSPQGVPRKRVFSSPSVEETDGEDSSVTVAVRVRPFSQREQRMGAKQAVRMQGNETIITSGEGVVHRFHYDHCFWSFDHSQNEFADQSQVYVSLARPLLHRSFEGYNTCLFAYGQTGSGKSYCIMGEGKEVGVIPQFCQELFDKVTSSATLHLSIKVQVSYYEIYNEKIYDLLASSSTKTKTRLRVREHPVMGPYVEDLSTYVASSYKDIEHWLSLGNRYRATAATGMNDRSSRSHSVFTIMLTQTSVLEGEERSKVSRINLIDLAGSERSSISQTSGERLKEGASINRSLHTLGKVISLLSERSIGRRRVYIPYRDSTLTWLLKESLGGNSKTAMIATISPANIHYNESLSTLRYAHQTRTIVNVARINEDPNARIIRELRDEISRLKEQIGSPLDLYTSSSQQEIKELKEKLRESEKLLSESTRTWQERLTETEKRKKEELEELKRTGALQVNNRLPNLVNLSEDPQLSEMLLYVLKSGVSTVGRTSCDIQLTGALIAEDHCSIVCQADKVVIQPSSDPDAQTFVNGSIITEDTTLHHGDRVVFGGEHYFRFNHPLEVERGGGKGGEKGKQGFEYARDELIRAQTEKIKAEQEQRWLAEREEMMKDVQEMRMRAEEDMEAQKREYESRLQELGAQMEDQSMELSSVQQSQEEREERIEELARLNQQLEQETIKQKHLLQLEKLKTEKELKDVTEQKTRLMSELEKEKEKLERDIQQLEANKHMRESAPFSTTPHQSASEVSLAKGAELVRLSMMLQEATIISKNLGKTLTFSREETLSSTTTEPEVRVRVNDTQLSQVTYWSLEKFENRLDQMRELHASQMPSSSASLELAESVISSGSDDTDPFHDATDTWYPDSLATPKSSPQRHLIRSFSAASSRSTTPRSNPHSTRRILDLTSSVPINHRELLSMSKGDSPGFGSVFTHPTHSHSLSQSLPCLCYDRVSKILSMKEEDGADEVTVFHRALQCVVDMTTATHDLESASIAHNPTQNFNIPLSETTEVRTHTLLLYVSLEQLMCHAHSLLASCHMMSHMTESGRGLDRQSLMEDTCQQLLTSLSHQTALYCSRLFNDIDRGRLPEGEEDTATDPIQESCYNVRESLDHVVSLLGRLALGWRVLETGLVGTEGDSLPQTNCWLVRDSLKSFLSRQQNARLMRPFYRGHSEWSRLRLESSCFSIQQYLSTLQPALKSPESSEVGSTVVQLLSVIMNFLQQLAAMQSEIWGVEEEYEQSIDDVIPNTQAIVNMLLNLRQVESAIRSLHSHTTVAISPPASSLLTPSFPILLSSNKELGASCNTLAASVQAVLRSCTADSAQDMMGKIQRLAQTTGRVVKSLSSLLKSNDILQPLPSHTHNHPVPTTHSVAIQNGTQQDSHDPYYETYDDYV